MVLHSGTFYTFIDRTQHLPLDFHYKELKTFLKTLEKCVQILVCDNCIYATGEKKKKKKTLEYSFNVKCLHNIHHIRLHNSVIKTDTQVKSHAAKVNLAEC